MIADTLRQLRKERGLTQREISEKIGIAQTTYAGYESGKHQPDLATLIKIADIHRTSLDILTGRIITKN